MPSLALTMSSAIHTAEWTEGTGGEFAIMIRVPKWASSVDKNTITVNGVSVKVGQPGSYTRVQGTWKAGDRVEAQCSLSCRSRLNWGSSSIVQ